MQPLLRNACVTSVTFLYGNRRKIYWQHAWQHKELLKENLKLVTKKHNYIWSSLLCVPSRPIEIRLRQCENLTLNKTLAKRIDAFEQWYFWRILKVTVERQRIKWTDFTQKKVTFQEILWNRNWHVLDMWWEGLVVLKPYTGSREVRDGK